MANQTAILRTMHLDGSPGPGLRITAIDTAGSAATFTDWGAATTFPVPAGGLRIVGIAGQGTTAPATATALQIKRNGNDLQGFIALAPVYDPTSTQAERLVGISPVAFQPGDSLALVSRA